MAVATKNGSGATEQIGRTLIIPEPQLRLVTVTIAGVTELLTHRFGQVAQDKIEKDQGGPRVKGPKEPRNPDAEFRDALYPIDAANEVWGFPAVGIKKALVNAGFRVAGETGTVLRASMNINADLLEIRNSKPRMRRDPVKLPNGSSSLAYRPGFPLPWEIDVPVSFNSSIIAIEQVLNLFQLAGFSIGIGDWRPERNGNFGQFRIEKVNG